LTAAIAAAARIEGAGRGKVAERVESKGTAPPVGREMIVRWFLGWPILGCRPTSDCRCNPRRKANASMHFPEQGEGSGFDVV